jgi:parallel beta-helix repeat protein
MHTQRHLRVLFALTSFLGFVVPCTAANDLCGATIVANLTLNEDLACAADALIVATDGITLDLNGHTIAGPGGVGVGISVLGRTHVTIVGGTVRSFATGVRVFDSTHIVLKENEFVDNGDGIDLQAGSRRITIKENGFSGNSTRGIMIRGSVTNNVIKENTFTGNRVGVLVFGGVDNTVKENIVARSSLAGIRINVLATGNLIVENTIMSNPAGVEFLVTATGAATGNVLVENAIALNACALKGPTAGNVFRENVFEGNGADSCP